MDGAQEGGGAEGLHQSLSDTTWCCFGSNQGEIQRTRISFDNPNAEIGERNSRGWD